LAFLFACLLSGLQYTLKNGELLLVARGAQMFILFWVSMGASEDTNTATKDTNAGTGFSRISFVQLAIYKIDARFS